MSGGSLNYASFQVGQIIESIYHQQEVNPDYTSEVSDEIKEIIGDLTRVADNLYQLEWYLSADISIEQMRDEWRK